MESGFVLVFWIVSIGTARSEDCLVTSEELCQVDVTSRQLQWSHPVLALGFRVSTVHDEEPCQIHMTLFGCQMQRSRPILAPCCHISAVLNEEPGQIQVASRGRLMERSRPVIAVGCRVGAMLDEEPCQVYVTMDGRPM